MALEKRVIVLKSKKKKSKKLFSGFFLEKELDLHNREDSKVRDAIASFEKLYFNEFQQTPIDFIKTKFQVGSDKEAVEYVYELNAGNIVRLHEHPTVPFSYYYDILQAEGFFVEESESTELVLENAEFNPDLDTIRICQRELLRSVNGVSFGKYFREELDELFPDESFTEGIRKISQKYSEIEFCKYSYEDGFVHFKQQVIGDMMYDLGIDLTPAFQIIRSKTFDAGLSPTSATITVYYLMRMLDLFGPELEERSVTGLAKAMKKWL